jgi:hypothetical protein
VVLEQSVRDQIDDGRPAGVGDRRGKPAMSDYLFRVSEVSNFFAVQWRLPDAPNVAYYLYWALLNYGVRYDIRLRPTVKNADAELWVVSGEVSGEYRSGLYWSHDLGLHRRIYSTLHKLTQHGLDGLPLAFHRSLRTIGTPIFLIETKRGGAFVMTFDDWERCFTSGQNGSKLADLAVTGRRR